MYVFEEPDDRLNDCTGKLNEVYVVLEQIRDSEKGCTRSLSQAEQDKLEYTSQMLEWLCSALNTVIEDMDRLCLRADDGSIFN